MKCYSSRENLLISSLRGKRIGNYIHFTYLKGFMIERSDVEKVSGERWSYSEAYVGVLKPTLKL